MGLDEDGEDMLAVTALSSTTLAQTSATHDSWVGSVFGRFMKIIVVLFIFAVSFNVKSYQKLSFEEFANECTSDLAKFASYKRH